LEAECIMISMVDLPLGATENHVCPFGGFALTMCCTRATTAVAAMMMMTAVTLTTTAVTSAAAAVMVTAKVRTMAMAAMA
jgi:hypothetical protein